MFIKSVDQTYEVIRKTYEDENHAIYYGRNPEDDQNTQIYEIMEIKNKEQIRRLLPVFMGFGENHAFTDFVICFSQASFLYVVFKYFEIGTLKKHLQENTYNLAERLEIAKNIYEQLLMKSIPKCLMDIVLEEENLLLRETLDVAFNYHISQIEEISRNHEAGGDQKLADWLKVIFVKELKDKSVPEMAVFIEDLNTNKYDDVSGSYKAFAEVYEALKAKDREGAVKPQTFWYCLKECLHKKIPLLKKIVMGIVIIAAIAYLVWMPVSSPKDGMAFDSIGTLKIQETENAQT